MEEERREHVMKMKKMEAEMEQVFELKVKEKKQKLKDSEAEVSVHSKPVQCADTARQHSPSIFPSHSESPTSVIGMHFWSC